MDCIQSFFSWLCINTFINIEGSLIYKRIVLTLLGAPVVTRADSSAAKLYG